MADAKNLPTDDICDDPQIAELKAKQMQKFKRHAALGSVADTFKFLAGVLITVGMALALPAFAGAVRGGFSAGLGALATGTGLLGVGLVAAAAIATGIAIVSSYTASNIWVDGQFNNYEIGAKSTAHHLVQEIEAHNLCLAENKNRADGKSWGEVAAASKAAAEARARA